MLHRFRLVLALACAALVAAPAALAVDVHVRVEGRTTTIYGSAQPLLAVPRTALDALETASSVAEFYYHVRAASFGRYVDQIGRYPAEATGGWVFKVNGVLPPVGADQVELKNGDTVLWYYADFAGGPAGPPTLDIRRQPRGCYQVWAYDDAGKRTHAVGALLRTGNRNIPTRSGRACIKGRHGLVRAQRAGSIRSQSVR